MPQQSERFRQMLIDFAKQIGKPDPEVYVDDGKWKARQGGNGVDYAKKTAVSLMRYVLNIQLLIGFCMTSLHIQQGKPLLTRVSHGY